MWFVPLKLSKQAEKLNVVPSGPLTERTPPSPLCVFPPWFRSRKVYRVFSCKSLIFKMKMKQQGNWGDMKENLDWNGTIKLDFSDIVNAIIRPIWSSYYRQTMPAQCLRSIASTSNLKGIFVKILFFLNDPLNKPIGKTYEFKQFQFVRIVSSASKDSYADYAYVWSIYGETNCIGRSISSVPWSILTSTGETRWSCVNRSRRAYVQFLVKSNPWK